MTTQLKPERLFPISIGFYVENDDGEEFSTYLFLFQFPESEQSHQEIVEWVFANNLQDACFTEQGVTREYLKNANVVWHSSEEYDNFTFQGSTYTDHKPDGRNGVRLSERWADEPFEQESIGPYRVMVFNHSKLPVEKGVEA